MFGALRASGGLHDHPNALEFKYRLRAYILGRNEGSLSDTGNVELDETSDLDINKEELLSGQCFADLTTPVCDAPDPLISELDELQYDGLENLAGFICHKLKKKEPSASCSSSSQETFTWVNHLSEGGLKKPTEQLMAQLHQLEQIFNKVNADSIFVCKEYLSNLLNLSSHIDCGNKIKILFFRSRMYFRIRTLNKSFQDKSLSKKRKMSKVVL